MKSETHLHQHNTIKPVVVSHGTDPRNIRGYRATEIDFAAVGVSSQEQLDMIITYLISMRPCLPFHARHIAPTLQIDSRYDPRVEEQEQRRLEDLTTNLYKLNQHDQDKKSIL